MGASGQAGHPSESIFAQALGLSASIKGEIKYAKNRREEIVQRRLERIDALLVLLNRLLELCGSILWEKKGKEWLFIGEDFERGNPSAERSLFLDYGRILVGLQLHCIFTISANLGYGVDRVRLPFPEHCILNILDTPVFAASGRPHLEGRRAILAIIDARISPELCDRTLLNQMIVASGGNLREVFSLIIRAAQAATIETPRRDRLSGEDVRLALTLHKWTDREIPRATHHGMSLCDVSPLAALVSGATYFRR